MELKGDESGRVETIGKTIGDYCDLLLLSSTQSHTSYLNSANVDTVVIKFDYCLLLGSSLMVVEGAPGTNL